MYTEASSGKCYNKQFVKKSTKNYIFSLSKRVKPNKWIYLMKWAENLQEMSTKNSKKI